MAVPVRFGSPDIYHNEYLCRQQVFGADKIFYSFFQGCHVLAFFHYLLLFGYSDFHAPPGRDTDSASGGNVSSADYSVFLHGASGF